MSYSWERIGGEAVPQWAIDEMEQEARARDETNAEIDAARGAITECIRKVDIQAKGSAADFSDVRNLLDDALKALPEIRS